MNLGLFKNINNAWSTVADKVLSVGDQINGTHEISNVSFEISDIEQNVLTVRDNFALHYYLGEMIWYASGANDVSFISKYGKIWNILSDDGITNNSAYGYILKYKHGFDQVDKVIELLKKDKNSRRAVININIPNKDVIETKDEMCTIALQFLLRHGKLNATGIMRSNDMYTGTPYDIYYFTEIQKYIANALDVDYGTYTHFVTSMHIYDRDISKISKSIENNLNMVYARVHIDGQILLEKGPEMYKKLEDVPRKYIKRKTLELAREYKIVEEY